jgi:hypothetical protein
MSWVLTLMLYVPGAALLGTLIVAITGTELPALTVIGLVGLNVQLVTGDELASHVALILPL